MPLDPAAMPPDPSGGPGAILWPATVLTASEEAGAFRVRQPIVVR